MGRSLAANAEALRAAPTSASTDAASTTASQGEGLEARLLLQVGFFPPAPGIRSDVPARRFLRRAGESPRPDHGLVVVAERIVCSSGGEAYPGITTSVI